MVSDYNYFILTIGGIRIKTLTLKQRRLIQAIKDPKNFGKPLSKIAPSAGYSVSARTIYTKPTKALIAKAFKDKGITKESMQDYFANLSEIALKIGDLTNANRCGENLSKTAGLFTDRSIVEQSIALTTEEKSALDRVQAQYRSRLASIIADSKAVSQADNQSDGKDSLDTGKASPGSLNSDKS